MMTNLLMSRWDLTPGAEQGIQDFFTQNPVIPSVILALVAIGLIWEVIGWFKN